MVNGCKFMVAKEEKKKSHLRKPNAAVVKCDLKVSVAEVLDLAS